MTEQHKTQTVYGILLAVAILWNLAFIAAPWSWAQGHTIVATGLYLMFSPVCHQRADRSFFAFGHHLAVCHRCTGIYLGALAGLLLVPLLSLARPGKREGLVRVRIQNRALLLLALALMAADVGGELLGIRHSTPMSRFLTGAFCGIVATFYLLPAIFDIFIKVSKESRPAVATDVSGIKIF
ncbi:MAG: DUF2085 domain-containing protein [Acidobacteriia bacterium]|nr:DUF2085 domain-containing protein [Terriglobia bacterium]